MSLAVFCIPVHYGTLWCCIGSCSVAKWALVTHRIQNGVILLGVLLLLGCCPAIGIYWSGLVGTSYSWTSRDTLEMYIGAIAYLSGSWPHTPAEYSLPRWLVVDPSLLMDPSHTIVYDDTSCTQQLDPLHSLGMGLSVADSPSKFPPLLYSSSWTPPLTSSCEFPLAFRSWSCIFKH